MEGLPHDFLRQAYDPFIPAEAIAKEGATPVSRCFSRPYSRPFILFNFRRLFSNLVLRSFLQYGSGKQRPLIGVL